MWWTKADLALTKCPSATERVNSWEMSHLQSHMHASLSLRKGTAKVCDGDAKEPALLGKPAVPKERATPSQI